jgi:hypothetical protein
MPKGLISFDLKGTKELVKQLRKLGPDVEQAVAKSLYQSGNKIMERSKDVYCPFDTGALRASGQVHLPEVVKHNVTVELGYGNSSVDYAIHVHEQDKNYKNGKQWKYLETPVKEGLKDVQEDLKAAIARAMKGS